MTFRRKARGAALAARTAWRYGPRRHWWRTTRSLYGVCRDLGASGYRLPDRPRAAP